MISKRRLPMIGYKSEMLRDRTMDNKFIYYIYNDYKQDYPICRLVQNDKLKVPMFF